MNIEDFNINRIRFSMKVFSTSDEKLSYLYSVKKEINRVIFCFERPKTLPIHMYADANVAANDGCPELKDFLKKEIDNYDLDPFKSRDMTRFPPGDRLSTAVKKEVMNYLELSKQVDAEIEFLEKIKQREAEKDNVQGEPLHNESKTIATPVEDFLKDRPEESNNLEKADFSALKKQIEKEVKDSIDSEQANIESAKLKIVEDDENKDEKSIQKIVWEGTELDLIKLFESLFNEKIISRDKYDKRFYFIDKFFIRSDGEAFSIDKLIHKSQKLEDKK